MKEVGVDVSYVHITPNISTGIAQICVAENGENQIVIVPGSNGKLSKSDVENCAELIKNADVLIGQIETPFETTLEAFKLNKGVRTAKHITNKIFFCLYLFLIVWHGFSWNY